MTKRKILNIVLFTVFSLAIFFLGVVVGVGKDVGNNLVNSNGAVDITKVVNLYSNSRSDKVNFDQYWEVWDKIKKNYVKQPVSDVDLFYASLEGLVKGLDDPYSIYFPPVKAKEFVTDLSGNFEGIGAQIGMKENRIIVVAPLEGSPAESAGLKAGDIIISVDGEDISNLSVDEVVLKIRGPKGSIVTLTVLHGENLDKKDIKITREKIDLPSVKWEDKGNGVIYLRINSFNDNTWSEFDKAVKDILLKNPKSIVLDLRGNPGGYLDTSVKVAAEWLKENEGVVVSEKFKDASTKEYTAKEGKHRFVGIKTVILVDEGTASGSEIVTGALQDYEVATVVGKTTYGKGSVQEFELLPDGSALKITVAEWYTPKQRQINKVGLDPDVTIDTDMFVQKEDTKGEKVEDYDDKGMEKALEILKQK
ncbi:MAG: S41 family peptidase [Candidatus Magasanikbacteria bacterium CG_4_10_14_0_2_um_filter_33_14]|uniref:S41 family peptidase n=1 Tax=Candidatus Magasanikbacteria bacterium CG_4_10_14_0_2_um_filter_33_14 TaxID=1974636 RepID=A0A2M7V8W3_9BACT|nr:MAG: S41 family peptidase [Candidatus Magasanikbacteria bacterium CG_4_10_14_0_2_um_filter_33_14]